MNNYFFFIGLLLTAACTKKVSEIKTSDSQIGFFNASEYLQSQLQNTRGKSFIRIDAGDTSFHEPSAAASDTMPSFSNGVFLLQFPNSVYYSRQTQPWISYLRTTPATHSIELTDTAMHTLISSRVQTASGLPVTVYYSDSLGHFRGWVLRDTVTETADAVRLRVFQLGPDAGDVFFTINGQSAAGFPDTLRYGTITPFLPWHDPKADTLQIRFYNAGDTTDVLTSATLTVLPGHAYNLLFTGYMNFQSFPDPVTGNYLSFNPDLKVLLTQNN